MLRFLLTSAGLVAIGIGAFKLIKKKSNDSMNTSDENCQEECVIS